MKYCQKCQRTYPESTRFCLEDGSGLSKDPHDLFGRTLLNKYKVDNYLAEGGSSAVYTARQAGDNRRVAVKILLARTSRNPEELLHGFLREASHAAQLKHPNIVEIIDAGRTPEGLGCLIMEWVEGQTLESRLKEKGRLGPETVFNLLRQIAAALDAAHRLNILHLDLKPTKILLLRKESGRDLVKVVDFSILNAFGNAFTPSYASPEQCLKSKALDSRSDIYSLGVLLYRMLAGRLPFEASSPADLILAHTTEAPPPITNLRPDVPQGIEQLLNAMLAKSPDDRPRSVNEVVRRYENAITMTNIVRVDDHPELAAEVKRPTPASPPPRPVAPPSAAAPPPPPPAPAAAPDAFATNFMMMQVDEQSDFSTNIDPGMFATNVMMSPDLSESEPRQAAPAEVKPAPRHQSVTMEIKDFNRRMADTGAVPTPTPAPTPVAKDSGSYIFVIAIIGGILILVLLIAYLLLSR
jgi:serine/threonine protein kinase